MPTEYELVENHSVSRITARRALDELAQQGLVERKRRVGTRVSYHIPSAPIEGHIDQAVESLIAFGRGTKVKVLELGKVPADKATAAALEIPETTPVVRAMRLRISDGQPIGAIESFVPASLGLNLTRRRLTKTPILELLRESELTIGAGTQVISAIPADPQMATLLQMEPRAPIIRIERIVRSSRNQPVLFTRARYRGDVYRVTVDLHGASVPEPVETDAG